MNENSSTEIEAAAFRRLVSHFKNRTDVQNIDLMVLAGFCRNCLSKWYKEEGLNFGQDIKEDEAREIIYGMPYKKWKKLYQKEASKEQIEALKASED